MKNDQLKHYRDWDCDGAIQMENVMTIKRYHEIKEETYNVNLANYDCFFAFSREQLEEGLKRIGKTKDQIYKYGNGLFGTHDGFTRYMNYLKQADERIKNECDPQEIYFYEFNNHECMIDYAGDTSAIELVIDLFGIDVLPTITRYNKLYSTEQLKLRHTEIKIEGLHFNATPTIPPYVWFSNVDGKAYCHYDNALCPVYNALDGDKQFVAKDKSWWGMSATYKDGKLCKWHKD